MGVEARAATADHDVFSGLSESMEQLLGQVRFGVALLDPDLRCILVNDRMAAIDGIAVAEHGGRRFSELDRQVAEAVEPLLGRALEEDQPIVEQEVVVSRTLADRSSQERFWLVSCYPLGGTYGSVRRCGLIVQDVTGQKRREDVQTGRLKMEALLSDLSTAFINVPVSEVDRKIEQGLQKVVEFLGVDRSTI